MEKIRLADGTQLPIIDNGACATDEMLTVTFIPEDRTLSALCDLLSDATKTRKITLVSSAGEDLEVYSNYTAFISIVVNQGDRTTITVNLKKVDELNLRLAALEAQMTDAQEALCDIYELIIG